MSVELTRMCPNCGSTMFESRDIVAVGRQSMMGDYYLKCFEDCGVVTEHYEISDEGIARWNEGKLKFERPNTPIRQPSFLKREDGR